MGSHMCCEIGRLMQRFSLLWLVVALNFGRVSPRVLLFESFDDMDQSVALSDRWIQSRGVSDGLLGQWDVVEDEYGDRGMRTRDAAKFYATSRRFTESFSNLDSNLVVQFSVRRPHDVDCAGGYVKILLEETEQHEFSGSTPYAIMFGPDVCGAEKLTTHLILYHHNLDFKVGESTQTSSVEMTLKSPISCEFDEFAHTYTLIIRPDGWYEVLIDWIERRSGRIEDDFHHPLPPRTVVAPESAKPADWVDVPLIPDLDVVKPPGYDDEPRMLPEEGVHKPQNWPDDKEWEAPMVPNPRWKGPWQQPMKPNPEYKGKWEPPEEKNVEYKHEEVSERLHAVCNPACSALGIELWQVRPGTQFDDILVTDSVELAQKLAIRARKKLVVEREKWYTPYHEGGSPLAREGRVEGEGEGEEGRGEDIVSTTVGSLPSNVDGRA